MQPSATPEHIRLIITSCRNPTDQIRMLMRDLNRVIPHSARVNRGKASLKDLSEMGRNAKADWLMILSRWQGALERIEFYKLFNLYFSLIPPVLYLRHVRFRREFNSDLDRTNIARLGIIKPVGAENLRLAEALYKILDSHIIEKEKYGEIYSYIKFFESEGGSALNFFSSRTGKETGPALYFKHVGWVRND